MRKYILLSILLALPFQGFCDRYMVTDRQFIKGEIKTIEENGGKITSIQTNRISDDDVSYTITYISGADYKAAAKANIDIDKYMKNH